MIELFNGGTDTVQLDGVVFDATWSAYTLANFVETLDGSNSAGEVTLTGNDESNLIIGNTSANVLIGGLGNDTLDGGGGDEPDQFNGGAGNDTYRIYHANDVITEANDGEIDIAEVFFHEEYRLAANARIEVLRAGALVDGVHLVGNAYSATIGGSAGLDTLDGGSAINTVHSFEGSLGNDTYIIVNKDDVIIWREDRRHGHDNKWRS